MKDLARALATRLAVGGIVLSILGLLPLCTIIGSCDSLQAASVASGLVLLVFALGRDSCRD